MRGLGVLKKRLSRLETKCGFHLPRITFTIVNVASKAPCLNPGPLNCGTAEGLDQIFERETGEDEDAFIKRLAALAPVVEQSQFASKKVITVYAESLRPDRRDHCLATAPALGNEARPITIQDTEHCADEID